MKKHLICILLLLTCLTCMVTGTPVQRVPAYPGVIIRVQPNGDSLQVYLRGDERNHYMMTIDGWQIIEDNEGWIRYAIQKNGHVIPGKRIAKNAEQRNCLDRCFLRRKGILKSKH